MGAELTKHASQILEAGQTVISSVLSGRHGLSTLLSDSHQPHPVAPKRRLVLVENLIVTVDFLLLPPHRAGSKCRGHLVA